MAKITFLGAGSTIFAKNILGDCILTPALNGSELALFDIDYERLKESKMILDNINKNNNNTVSIVSYKSRKAALKESDYVINAIQVGGYEPATVID
ncbi:MAG: alpha-glucosidase/alpha-galactosidase, partial [bacterium]